MPTGRGWGFRLVAVLLASSALVAGARASGSERAVVAGTVVDSHGRPMAGAKIRLEGPNEYHAVTDTEGRYSLRVPVERYTIHAFFQARYRGETFLLPLHPTDNRNDEVDVEGGVVKNFRWQLSGLMPGHPREDPLSYYGAYVKMRIPFLDGLAQISPASLVTFTITPVAPRIDGTQGRAAQVRVRVGELDGPRGTIVDIPIGVYALEAVLTLPDGRNHRLVLSENSGTPYQKIALQFHPNRYQQDSDSQAAASVSMDVGLGR